MFVLLALGLLISSPAVLGACTEKCKEPTLLYESLRCTPYFASPDDCCPSKYDCTKLDENAKSKDESKCYFEGRSLSHGEDVNNDETYGNCKVGCSCRPGDVENGESPSHFTCAVLDCPEWLGYHAEPGCHLKYEAGKCCSNGKVCPNASTPTCEVDGKIYQDGVRFDHPTEKCVSCACQEGFKGELIEPFCKKQKCIEEINKQKQVYTFCAPSYISLEDCCPFNWVCPKDSDQIVKAATDSENKCKFGTSLLNIGDKFSRTKGKGEVSCECRIPPYMTCIQNYDYNTFGNDD